MPDYKSIYSDIISLHYPEKVSEYSKLLEKKNMSSLYILELEMKIFGNTDTANKKHRSYTKEDILEILNYQKKHKLNNMQIANYFHLSRNSIAKWKKIFLM
jgi:DNA-binding transcriptional regulator YiaG